MSKTAVQTERKDEIKNVVEAALMASEEPLSVRKLQNLFEEEGRPESKEIKAALKKLEDGCEGRGVELCQIGKGFRFQTRDRYSPWMRRMRDTRPPRYSRALLETLSIIAYRQPVTRGDIEGIRGVAVSSDIMRVLLDREWIGQVGHRDVPGRPALYATSKGFLEYFNLRSLSDLPTLLEPRDISEVAKELNITLPVEEVDEAEGHEADVIGVDADGVPLDADDEDEEALSAEEDRRIEKRRLEAEEEINESLAEIDEELAAVPKVTKKSIDKLMGLDEEADGDKTVGDKTDGDDAEAKAPKGDSAVLELVQPDAGQDDAEQSTQKSADESSEPSQASSDSVAEDAAQADVVQQESDDDSAESVQVDASEIASVNDADESASIAALSDDADVDTDTDDDTGSETTTTENRSPVRLVSDESVTAAVTQSLAGLSAADFGPGVVADFDDDLDDVEALNPVVHNVGGDSSEDSEIDTVSATDAALDDDAPNINSGIDSGIHIDANGSEDSDIDTASATDTAIDDDAPSFNSGIDDSAQSVVDSSDDDVPDTELESGEQDDIDSDDQNRQV